MTHQSAFCAVFPLVLPSQIDSCSERLDDNIKCFPQQVAPKIKAMMMESGTTMVGYQPQGDKVNFFRMVISNAAATRSDIDFLIEEIERLGHDL